MSIEDLRISLSNNVIDRINKGSKHQINYELIISSLAYMRLKKCNQYGESRYEETDEEFNFWMTFSDVHRKYIRLRELNKSAIKGDIDSLKSILDCYSDLANYAIMAIQLIEPILKEKTKDLK